jgi:hypothetical protein
VTGKNKLRDPYIKKKDVKTKMPKNTGLREIHKYRMFYVLYKLRKNKIVFCKNNKTMSNLVLYYSYIKGRRGAVLP